MGVPIMVSDPLQGGMASGWGAAHTVPLSFFAGALCMALLMIAVSAYQRLQPENPHSRESIDTFTARFAEYGFDPEICRHAYAYIREEQNIAFSIEPFDRLKEDLGFDSQQVAEMMHVLLYTSGRKIGLGEAPRPVHTVEELLRFLEEAPRKTPDEALLVA